MARNFAGTFSVLIPLHEVGKSNKEFVETYVDKDDMCMDPAVFKGRCVEDDPHITLLMGLPDDVEKVRSVCEKFRAFDILIGGSGHFSNSFVANGRESSYDVLWRDVTCLSKNLDNLHVALKNAFLKEWHFPEYKPHVTVCYLNKGTSGRYENLLQHHLVEVKVKEIIFKKFQDKDHPITRIVLDD